MPQYDIRAWAESRRLRPTAVDGKYYWLPDETPTCLWFDAGSIGYDTEELAWTALESAFNEIANELQIANIAINFCAEALDRYADALPDEAKQRPYRNAVMIIKRLKGET